MALLERRKPTIMSDNHAAVLGFPAPQPNVVVLDNRGRLWRWVPDRGLGALDGGLWQSLVGLGGGIGGKIATSAIGGPTGAAIGAGITLISTLISAIFGAHAAKSQREDEISGAWAAQGPTAIDAVMAAYRSGQVSASEAISGLQQIEQQFMQMAAPISKYNGAFGSFPNPNGPRPSGECNWACGTYWDLHKQISGLMSTIQSGGSSGGGLGAIFSGDPLPLVALAVLGFFLLGK